MVYADHGVLFNLKKKRTSAIGDSMDEAGGHCAK
jgi:hypothetical protein